MTEWQVPIWWLLYPVPIWAIVGAVYSTYRWKKFVADMIHFQVTESKKRPDSWTEQLALQRLKALALTIDDDPEFVERCGFDASQSKG